MQNEKREIMVVCLAASLGVSRIGFIVVVEYGHVVALVVTGEDIECVAIRPGPEFV
ncbi:MAG: hypothetical protein NTX52_07650 [Planctomycetota bacterium]|nr:hypothetical protein [Planctomycetota bacterium]